MVGGQWSGRVVGLFVVRCWSSGAGGVVARAPESDPYPAAALRPHPRLSLARASIPRGVPPRCTSGRILTHILPATLPPVRRYYIGYYIPHQRTTANRQRTCSSACSKAHKISLPFPCRLQHRLLHPRAVLTTATTPRLSAGQVPLSTSSHQPATKPPWPVWRDLSSLLRAFPPPPSFPHSPISDFQKSKIGPGE